MAYKTEINVGGRLTEVTHFDHTAQQIDDAVDAVGTKLPTLEDAIAAVSQSGAQLLDNWYFVPTYDSGGGMILPINQRGVALDTAFTTAGGYFLDRWLLVSGTVLLTASGLLLNGTLRQKREIPIGKTEFAASVLCAAGEATAEYDDRLMYFDITSDGGTVVAAKLEEGTKQTLYKELEDGTLQLLDPLPDPALELVACQRFLRRFKGDWPTVACSSGRVVLNISWESPMRSAPTVIPVGDGKPDWIRVNGSMYNEGSGIKLDPVSMFSSNQYAGSVQWLLQEEMSALQHHTGYLSPIYFFLSAEL